MSTIFRTILFAHAEVALHPTFGDQLYWTARRSLRYNRDMQAVANAFRKIHLSSTNEADNIHLADKWEDDKVNFVIKKISNIYRRTTHQASLLR